MRFAIHYRSPNAAKTACGKSMLGARQGDVHSSSDSEAVTCRRCLAKKAKGFREVVKIERPAPARLVFSGPRPFGEAR